MEKIKKKCQVSQINNAGNDFLLANPKHHHSEGVHLESSNELILSKADAEINQEAE